MRAWTQEFDAITKLHFVHDTPKFGFHETKFCGVPEERRVLDGATVTGGRHWSFTETVNGLAKLQGLCCRILSEFNWKMRNRASFFHMQP